jgi:hypothetical protein
LIQRSEKFYTSRLADTSGTTGARVSAEKLARLSVNAIGAVLELSQSSGKWRTSVLHSFTGLNLDGAYPNSALVRDKLDLLSRMVIPENTYDGIKHQIGVAKATESVKFAG